MDQNLKTIRVGMAGGSDRVRWIGDTTVIYKCLG